MRRTICLFAVAALAGGVGELRAATLVLPLSVHAQATSPDETTFTLTSPASPVVTSWTPDATAVKERRGVFEFSLAGLPDGATIETAELTFDVAHVDSDSGGSVTLYPSVTFWGYAGDNALDPSDAGHTSNQLATETLDFDGPWSIFLNVDNIQDLFDGGAAAIGVLTYANSEDLAASIWTAASGSIAAPAITITYSAGTSALNGDFNGDGSIDGVDLGILNQGFGQHLTGYENGDFNRDGVINFDDYALFDRALATFDPPTAPIALVPEPASLCVLAMLPVATRQRRGRRVGTSSKIAR